MSSFQDFVIWAGGTRKAAKHLGCSPSKVSRLFNGHQDVDKEIAERCEAVSHGLFKKERVMWPATSEAA